MALAQIFSLLKSKKTVERLTPEEFRDKYFQMTAENIKMLTQDNVSKCSPYTDGVYDMFVIRSRRVSWTKVKGNSNFTLATSDMRQTCL